jgi:thiol-disulfide isomerase/thioredoxin
VACGEADVGASPVELPSATLSDLFGTVLYTADGTEVGIESVEGKSIIGIYFQSPSCPACAQFTPFLIGIYQQLIQAGKSFEIVLVSFAGSQEEMLAHMRDTGMPWLAVPSGGTKAVALAARYGIQFVPTLIVIDRDGNTISMSGHDDVAEKGAHAYDDWLAKSTGA